MIKLDDEKLWDLFLVIFGIVAAKAADALEDKRETKRARKAAKHFKRP